MESITNIIAGRRTVGDSHISAPGPSITLEYVSAEMKNNKDVVSIACNNNGRVLQYACYELRNDYGVLESGKWFVDQITLDSWADDDMVIIDGLCNFLNINKL